MVGMPGIHQGGYERDNEARSKGRLWEKERVTRCVLRAVLWEK